MQSEKPVLAICVGMQALLSESEEFGLTADSACICGTSPTFP